MSTRSEIARLNEDGTVDSIYCHHDGYPQYNGRILLRHYSDPEKVNALLALGNISFLAEEIGEKHDFDGYGNNWCRAYGRDSGEEGQEAKRFPSIHTWAQEMRGDVFIEWIYLFRQGHWWFSNTKTPLIPLRDESLRFYEEGGERQA